MTKNLAEISGKSLADFMEVSPTDYISEYFNRARENEAVFVRIVGLLTLDNVLKIPTGTRLVSKGEYKSGDIWIDNHYDAAYLYVGKLSEGNVDRNVILTLTGNANKIGECHIIGGDNSKSADNYKICLDERIFSKY